MVEVAEIAEVIDAEEVAEVSTKTLKSCRGTVISWPSLVTMQVDMLGLVHPIKLRRNMFRKGK